MKSAFRQAIGVAWALGAAWLPLWSARAAVYTWDGGGANNYWSTSANWDPNGATVLWAARRRSNYRQVRR